MRRCDMISGYPTLNRTAVQDLIRQKQEHAKLHWVPYDGDPGWKERIKENWWAVGYEGSYDKVDKRMLTLRDKLLSIGGCEACLAFYEEDLEDILEYGQVWDNLPVKRMKGRPSRCHANSANLWFNNRNAYKDGHTVIICTGYALTEDGVWRQHSWLVHAKPRSNMLIETTVPRIAYFGFGMTYDQASEFARDNY